MTGVSVAAPRILTFNAAARPAADADDAARASTSFAKELRRGRRAGGRDAGAAACGCMAQAPGAPAQAANPQLAAAQATFDALPEVERKAIQNDLIWAGHFNGAVSGSYGPLTFRGINALKAGSRGPPDGILTPVERRALAQAARGGARGGGLSRHHRRHAPAYASAFRPSCCRGATRPDRRRPLAERGREGHARHEHAHRQARLSTRCSRRRPALARLQGARSPTSCSGRISSWSPARPRRGGSTGACRPGRAACAASRSATTRLSRRPSTSSSSPSPAASSPFRPGLRPRRALRSPAWRRPARRLRSWPRPRSNERFGVGLALSDKHVLTRSRRHRRLRNAQCRRSAGAAAHQGRCERACLARCRWHCGRSLRAFGVRRRWRRRRWCWWPSATIPAGAHGDGPAGTDPCAGGAGEPVCGAAATRPGGQPGLRSPGSSCRVGDGQSLGQGADRGRRAAARLRDCRRGCHAGAAGQGRRNAQAATPGPDISTGAVVEKVRKGCIARRMRTVTRLQRAVVSATTIGSDSRRTDKGAPHSRRSIPDTKSIKRREHGNDGLHQQT